MASDGAAIDGVREARTALVLLFRKPFLTIVLVSIVLGIADRNVAELIGTDPTADLEFWGTISGIFFVVTSFYLQIATILAAGGNGEGSAEGWMRAALRHRCFWRFLAASFVMFVLIVVGAIALIVGGVVVASAVTLAQPAAVLERLGPFVAVRRSIELTRPARKAVGIVFVLFWFPPLLSTLAIWLFEVDRTLPVQIGGVVVGTVLGIASTLAVTRLFVKLGGPPTPPLQALRYKEDARSRP